MLEFLTSGPLLPFSIALAVMAGIALLEVVTALLGFALSNVLESGFAGSENEIDVEASPMSEWFHLGQVPTLILLILLLVGFAIGGVTIQAVATAALGKPLPLLAAVPIALVLGVLAMRFGGMAARRFVLRDETTALSADALLGHSATIMLGATRKGTPSQAKVRDKFGQTHYILVEPLQDQTEFSTGQSVMLVQRDGPKYYVIEDSVEALLSMGQGGPDGVGTPTQDERH